jgi:hypothetical protein
MFIVRPKVGLSLCTYSQLVRYIVHAYPAISNNTDTIVVKIDEWVERYELELAELIPMELVAFGWYINPQTALSTDGTRAFNSQP